MAGSEEGGSANKSGNPMRWWDDDASYKKKRVGREEGNQESGPSSRL